MQLWSDYEGKTLAGTFPIEALLLTEGRNASFATHDRAGRPAILRLTEALNDQQEMRARYGAIQEVGQPNLITIEDYGDVEIEGTPLIYLVMEPTQESLADILRVRRLSIEETGEVATSLVAALEALHAHGLVHGHVEPESVLAAGQVIKLRSDCVRPAPEGEDGERAYAEDVFGLADVLTRSLTQQPLVDASDALALPEPYAAIVRNVVRGHWGLEEVASEIRHFVRPAAPPTAAAPPVTIGAPQPGMAALAAAESAAPIAVESTVDGLQSAVAEPAARTQPLARRDTQETHSKASASGFDYPLRVPSLAGPGNRRLWVWAVSVAALCLLLVIWHYADAGSSTAIASPESILVPAPSRASTVPPAPAQLVSMATPQPVSVTPSRSTVRRSESAPAHGQVWRVVAYTYNVEAQARAKARAIEKRHMDLDPQVFSRTGKAPYLVTLGGGLTEPVAALMRQRARSEGIARDVYIQNYSH